MIRALKIAAVVMVLAAVSLVAALAWLVRSEQGSRWLLEQGLQRAPVPIEVSGVAGTLAAGLAIDSVRVLLPMADVRVREIVVSWSPSALLAGIVQIDEASIAELSIDVLQSDEAGDPPKDRLFWLALPLQISIESGRVERLRIEAAEFTNLHIAGGIGHGHLEVETLAAQIANADVQISGELTGPSPGYLEASGSWTLPAANLRGVGRFSGNIDKLAVTHVLNMPDTVNFDGHIYDLFAAPTLAGEAEWSAVRLPGAAVLYSNSGRAAVTSDFRKARLDGDSTLLLEGWPEAPLRIEAVADIRGVSVEKFTLQALAGQVSGTGRVDYDDGLRGEFQISGTSIDTGPVNQAIAGRLGFASTLLIESTDALSIDIDAYRLEALGGAFAGSGRIRYANGLSGQLQISGAQIDTGLINSGFPGQLGFISTLQIESTDAFTVDVSEARALIAGNEFSGHGRTQWQEGKISAVAADIVAGTNQLSADVQLGGQLAGTINARLRDLAQLWPELEGSLVGDIRLGGNVAKPQVIFSGEAASLLYESQGLDTLSVSGEVEADGKLSGTLKVTGLVSGEQAIGNLDAHIAGTLAAFETRLEIAGNLVNAEIRAEGSWDGTYLTQRFTYGWLEPAGFERWQLEQDPMLRVSAEAGQLGAHCWKQSAASICLQSGNWDANRQQIAVLVDSFVLATLKPLLADGYRIDGTVDGAVSVVRSSEGLRGEAHWRQSRTIIGYADEIDEFQTELDEVQIDITSTDERTDFSATVGGEAGLTLTATATVLGPLAEASPVVAAANGSLPSIGLLRPYVQRVVRPGALEGELSIDLKVGGTLGDPVFTGGAYLADGVLGLLDTGITLADINIAAESNSSESLKLTGRFRSGAGQAELTGDIRSKDTGDGELGLIADIRITGKNLAIVRSPDLNVDASPDLKLSAGEGVFDISGRITIPYARAQVRELPRNAATRSADVIVHTSESAVVDESSGTILTGNVEVMLGNDVRFNGFGLDSALEGSLRLTQKRGGFLRSAGTVRVRDGFLTGYGKELRVDQGELTFVGPLDDPLINVRVSRESVYEGRQYTIGLRLTGSAQNVKTEPFSRPTMSDNDVLAFLLIDRPAGTGADASGAAVAMGLGQLVPGDGGLLGLDEVSFETNEANQAAMVAGKRINDDIFVRYVFGSFGEPGAFRIRYRLGKGFSIEASTGSAQSLDLIYLLER